MAEDGYKRELLHLRTVEALLEKETRVPVRIKSIRKDLSGRHLEVTISGIRGLVANPDSTNSPARASFKLDVRIPENYPETEMPDIRFVDPIPFHPHIYRDGRICWGNRNHPNPDLFLADWLILIIEYLQYYQCEGSSFHENPDSLANSEAMQWWQTHEDSLPRYVPVIRNMARLRHLVDRAKG